MNEILLIQFSYFIHPKVLGGRAAACVSLSCSFSSIFRGACLGRFLPILPINTPKPDELGRAGAEEGILLQGPAPNLQPGNCTPRTSYSLSIGGETLGVSGRPSGPGCRPCSVRSPAGPGGAPPPEKPRSAPGVLWGRTPGSRCPARSSQFFPGGRAES